MAQTRQASHSVFLPGENHHHGIEVNGSICQSLQHELFICQVDEGGGYQSEGRREAGREGGKRLQSSLTDNPFLVLHQLGFHYGGKLIQSLHCLKRQGHRAQERKASHHHRLCSKAHWLTYQFTAAT